MNPNHLKGMLKKVYRICQARPECVENDKKLILEVWKEEFTHLYQFTPTYLPLDYDLMKRLPGSETIRRSRQKLTELGLLRARTQTRARRKAAEVEVHSWARKTKIPTTLF